MDDVPKMGFRSLLAAVPGGLYFYESNGRKVSTPSRDAAVAQVAAIMRDEGRDGDPETELATYMCAFLQPVHRDAICVPLGPAKPGRPAIGPKEAVENSIALVSGKNVETFDRIEARLAVCLRCPRHERRWCPSCAGHFERVMVSLSARRPRLPLDRMTGVCACAKAYESAVCSIPYARNEPVWDGAPETCWRRTEDV